MKIVGYSDPLSVQPGQTIRFMISSQPQSYRAQIVRLRHTDTNPRGPGFKTEALQTSVSGEYPGRHQVIHSGSYANVPHQPLLDCGNGLSLAAWIFPTTPQKGVQGLLTKWSAAAQTGYGLFIEEDGSLALWLGSGDGRVEKVRTGAALKASQWYFVAATYAADSGAVCLYQEPLSPWPLNDSAATVQEIIAPNALGTNTDPFLMAASGHKDAAGKTTATAHFNGKIDCPQLWGRALERDQLGDTAATNNLIGRWDFSIDIATQQVTDTSPQGNHGCTINMPARGMSGHNWSGDEVDFKAAPAQYGAVHFHDDDLEDACWDVDFEWTVPQGWPNGVYAAHLSATDAEDYIPFYVTPAPAAPRARIAFLVPTVSYTAYANQQFKDLVRAALVGRDDRKQDTPNDQYMRAHNLLSLYDLHSDGSGVCYSSRRRPIVNMRPGYRNPELSLAATWPHLLNADLHLLDWLDGESFEYDVITDDDLHREGAGALEPYRVIISGTHPEYWTGPMLGGLESYLGEGGRIMYLGGNGFYWVTSFDPQRPHIIEVRRSNGSRAWDACPGEYYHSTTGEIGGLWRLRDRAPQKLLGVGFTSMGGGSGRPYRRQPDSFDARAAFIFEGIGKDELIGDFPSLVLGHGAAGFEIDRLDHALGTPDHALLLASSFEHSDSYRLAIEDQLVTGAATGGSQHPLVRADLVYFEGPKGGAVFSVGSISWCGSLSYNNGDNNVARITANVLRRFAADPT
jgi:N,N-dimethylformamidase